MPRIGFMNIAIDNLTADEALLRIDELIQADRASFVVTPNVDHLIQLQHNAKLVKAYENADLILADGKPLIWISKWYGTPIKEKISGSDLFPRLCELASRRHYKMFFLGAAEGVAKKAANNLTTRYPGLEVAGVYSPPFGFEKSELEMERIRTLVINAAPQILIVALGCPKQEVFMLDNCKELNVPISLGLGATLDFEAGKIKRAPKWMANHGLEWAYRITQDPRRLTKRYLIDDMKIVSLAIKYRKRDK